MILTNSLKLTLLTILIVFFAGCSPATPKPVPEIYLSVSPYNLSIAQGEEGAMFIDISGSNTENVRLIVVEDTPEDTDATKNIAMRVVDNEAARNLSCLDQTSENHNCTFNASPVSDGSFDIEKLGITLSVPTNHPVGVWNIHATLTAWNGTSRSGPSTTISESIILTVRGSTNEN